MYVYNYQDLIFWYKSTATCDVMFSGWQSFTVLFKDAISYRDYLQSVAEEWVWSIGRLIVTQENRSTQWEACPNITLFEKSPTYIGLGLNPGFRSDRKTAEGLSHGAATLLINKTVGFHNSTLSNLLYVYQTVRHDTSEDINPKKPSLPIRIIQPFETFAI